MNVKQVSYEHESFWRRFELPFLFSNGEKVEEWVWWLFCSAVLFLMLLYVAWMYFRDSRSVGWWALPLGLLRFSVFVALGFIFLLRSERYTQFSSTGSKVIVIYDVSRSMSNSRDDLPTDGKTFFDMPTRQDKVREFMTAPYRWATDNRDDKERGFFPRLLERSPISAYRFAGHLDAEFRYFEPSSNMFWPKHDFLKLVKSYEGQGEAPPPGIKIEDEHWKNWLYPVAARDSKAILAELQEKKTQADQRKAIEDYITRNRDELPPGWDPKEVRSLEYARVLIDNASKSGGAIQFFDQSHIGEAVSEVLEKERGTKIEGVIVITDGKNSRTAKVDVKDVANEAERLKIPIFVVAIGKADTRVKLDVVQNDVPPTSRPDQPFKVEVKVNGEGVVPGKDTFDIYIDVTRFKRKANDEIELLDLLLCELDPEGKVIKDTKLVLPRKVTIKVPPHQVPQSSLKNAFKNEELVEDPPASGKYYLRWVKENPIFKAGNPPTCNIEFELTAKKLAEAAGVKLDEGKKYGLMPDPDAEFRFQARVPRDVREITDKKEHVSEVADMKVLEKPLRILLVTSVSSREFQFVKNLLVREEAKGRIQPSILLQKIPEAEKRQGIVHDIPQERVLDYFPDKLLAAKGEEKPQYCLSSYDVVVAFDVNWEPTEVSPEQAKLLREWVFKHGGGFVFVAGQLHTKSVASPLNQARSKEEEEAETPRNPFIPIQQMLPVQLEFSEKELATIDVPRRLKWHQANAGMEFLRIDKFQPDVEKWKEGWDRFFNEEVDEDGKGTLIDPSQPPLRGFYSYYPVKRVKDGCLNLAGIDAPTAVMTGSVNKQPFLASGPWGKGKVYWIASLETWRLRMYREGFHERFWTGILDDVGAASANTVRRRIEPVMTRHGKTNRTVTFSGRFETPEGKPLSAFTEQPPRIEITMKQGTAAVKGNLVRILDKGRDKEGKEVDFRGRLARVTGVRTVREPGKNEDIAVLDVDVYLNEKKDQKSPMTLGATKTEIVYEDVVYQPQSVAARKPSDPTKAVPLSAIDRDKIDKANNGWFEVQFQPLNPAEFEVRVDMNRKDAPKDARDPTGVFLHRFTASPDNPEIDDNQPDANVLWQLATPYETIIKPRLDSDVQARVEKALKVPEGLKPDVYKIGDPQRLYFEGTEAAKVIPDCVKSRPQRMEDFTDDYDTWDDGPWGMTDYPTHKGEKQPLLPWILGSIIAVLALEWSIRKLIRLA